MIPLFGGTNKERISKLFNVTINITTFRFCTYVELDFCFHYALADFNPLNPKDRYISQALIFMSPE